MPAEQLTVKLTRNFERNLDDIERFLEESEASGAFDLLLDELTETVLPVRLAGTATGTGTSCPFYRLAETPADGRAGGLYLGSARVLVAGSGSHPGHADSPSLETELLVELALERLPSAMSVTVADLGTGSGAIALALAVERPQARIVATDRSPAALTVARRNAQRLGIRNVEFRQGDWCEPLVGDRFDLIASNPPSAAAADPHRRRGELRFEPPGALAAGVDGLDALRVIIAQAPDYLKPNGWLLLGSTPRPTCKTSASGFVF